MIKNSWQTRFKRSWLLLLSTSLILPGLALAEGPAVGGRPVEEFLPPLAETLERAVRVDPAVGIAVQEIADNLYLITDGVWQNVFLTTGEGVLLFDAPASYAAKIPGAITSFTDEPVTHLVYSHAHKDHIGGSSVFRDLPDLTIVAHAEVAAYLRDVADPDRMLPTREFSESLTLELGSERVVLEEVGPYHSAEADLFIEFPRQRFLYAIDTVTPGWVTFQGLDLTANVHGYLAMGQQLLGRDFDLFSGGHLTQLGTRSDVERSVQYTEDLLDVATGVFSSTDMVSVMARAAEHVGWNNKFLLFRHYQETMVDDCANRMVERWKTRLSGVDVWAQSHCDTMLTYLRVD